MKNVQVGTRVFYAYRTTRGSDGFGNVKDVEFRGSYGTWVEVRFDGSSVDTWVAAGDLVVA